MVFKCGLISSNIVSKELWLKWSMEKYFESSWIHMGYVVELLNRENCKTVIVFDMDYIETNISTPKGRWGENGTFLLIGLSLVNLISQNLNKKNKIGLYFGKKVITGGLWWYPKAIYLARYQGLQITREIRRQIKNAVSYNPIKYYFACVPAMQFPLCFFDMYKRIKSKLKTIKLFREINALLKRRPHDHQ
jgi:hypothetical protein